MAREVSQMTTIVHIVKIEKSCASFVSFIHSQIAYAGKNKK